MAVRISGGFIWFLSVFETLYSLMSPFCFERVPKTLVLLAGNNMAEAWLLIWKMDWCHS
jgi:hypothetical protein